MSTREPRATRRRVEARSSDIDNISADEALQRIISASRPSWFVRNRPWLLPLATVVVILVVWEILGRLGLINKLFFSYPSAIAEGFYKWNSQGLWTDLTASGKAFGIGMAIALLGIPAGIVVGSVRNIGFAVDPLIQAMYSTPMVALTPLFVIIFGLGLPSISAVVALMAIFPILILTAEGVRTVDGVLINASKVFGARRWDVYRDVVVPSIVPFIISGLRLAIGRGVIGVVIGEFIGAVAGVGYRIRADAGVFNTDRYLAGIVILMVFSVGLNELVKRLEARLAPWRAR